MSALRLRAAGMEDAERLLAWRNDPATRAASFSGEAVTMEEHERWLRARLADEATLLLIAEHGGEAVGQVRVDREGDGVGVVSIALAPAARGRGLGVAILHALVVRLDLGVTRLRALVKPENDASRRLFARAGYAETGRDPEAITFERSV